MDLMEDENISLCMTMFSHTKIGQLPMKSVTFKKKKGTYLCFREGEEINEKENNMDYSGLNDLRCLVNPEHRVAKTPRLMFSLFE